MKAAHIGEIIAGRYRIEKLLGEGGMGAVYLARQVGLNRDVAVKLLHADVSVKEQARERFQREARAMAALSHPNSVKIFDFGQHEGRLFLVMECLQGKSLDHWVGEEKPILELPRIYRLAQQVGAVLTAAHHIGLVHRDLKPENILLETTADGLERAVVVDFGLAFIAEREDAARLTQEGAIAGTPAYMSPEQAEGSVKIGPASDVYSFGCVLYEMACGFRPFTGAPMWVISMHMLRPPEPPSRRNTDVFIPRRFEELILRMMAKKPEDRPIAEELVERVGTCLESLEESERGRGEALLQPRAKRMISQASTPKETSAAVPEGDRPTRVDRSAVAMVGDIDDDLIVGLYANDFHPLPATPEDCPEGIQAIYVAAQQPDALQWALQTGLPVLYEADVSQMENVRALLEMGVSDVVSYPARVDHLAKKISRAMRKKRRRRKG